MRLLDRLLSIVSVLLLLIPAVPPASAQLLPGPPAMPQYKYSTPMPPGVASPDQVETRFGTLHFFNGVPDQASTEKIYDNLDYQRAVQAYLLALPVVNQVANRAVSRTDRSQVYEAEEENTCDHWDGAECVRSTDYLCASCMARTLR